MLDSSHRILRSQFPAIHEKQSVFRADIVSVSFYAGIPGVPQHQATVIISKKKYASSAVRHHLRRLVYEVLREKGICAPTEHPKRLVVVLEKTSPTPDYRRIHRALAGLLLP